MVFSIVNPSLDLRASSSAGGCSGGLSYSNTWLTEEKDTLLFDADGDLGALGVLEAPLKDVDNCPLNMANSPFLPSLMDALGEWGLAHLNMIGLGSGDSCFSELLVCLIMPTG